MLSGLKINKKAPEEVKPSKDTDSRDQQEPQLQKKWMKNDKQIEVSTKKDYIPKIDKDLNYQTKYDSEFQQSLLKQRVEEKGQNNDDDQKNQTIKQQQKKEQKQEQNVIKREIKQEKHNTKILSTCGFCLQNEMIGENYILANGNHSLMILPNLKFYDNYWHVYILPIEHIQSLQELEEDAWQEIRNFMKCLVGAFDSINMETVFYENAYRFNRLPHCILECVGIPYVLLKDAKIDMYFRQGMEDLDGYWSTHQKIYKLTREQGGIRKQIPKGFPYFYVDFSTQYGYGHIIENEKYFSKNFAREIIANVLKVEKNKIVAPPKFTPEEIIKTKEKFLKFWDKFDWTKVLHNQDENQQVEELQ